jgi:hypothetical protein
MVAERLNDAMNAHDIDAFYVEQVEQGGAGIDAAVRDMSGDA